VAIAKKKGAAKPKAKTKPRVKTPKFIPIKEKLKKDMGHWEYTGVNVDISENFGFVYLVINKTKNKYYIGKKQFWAYKKNSYVRKGKSLWRAYGTSSEHVCNDRREGDVMEFHMLGVFETRAWCNYTEAWLQMALCSITDRDSEGERRWYNNQVAAIRFIPKLDPKQHDTMETTLKRATKLIKLERKEDVKIIN